MLTMLITLYFHLNLDIILLSETLTARVAEVGKMSPRVSLFLPRTIFILLLAKPSLQAEGSIV